MSYHKINLWNLKPPHPKIFAKNRKKFSKKKISVEKLKVSCTLHWKFFKCQDGIRKKAKTHRSSSKGIQTGRRFFAQAKNGWESFCKIAVVKFLAKLLTLAGCAPSQKPKAPSPKRGVAWVFFGFSCFVLLRCPKNLPATFLSQFFLQNFAKRIDGCA